MLRSFLYWLAFLPCAASAQSSTQAELDTLVKAAKAEGEVLFYSGATENVARNTSNAFTAKYGIKAGFIRLPGVTITRRFAGEAEAGVFAADLFMFAGAAQAFASESGPKGWVESVAASGIPVLKSREFPARFLIGDIAIIQVAPWGISYNSEKLKAADVPKDWTDLLLPKFKGQILMPDPKSADSYSDFWGILLDRLGESYLVKMREQNPRFYLSGVPTTNALAAGEGMIAVPAVGAQIAAVREKGAPIEMTQPSLTTGSEMKLVMTHRGKAKHPNAARLFANYLMSTEGNKVFNADPGSLSVYDTSGLPSRYESPKPNALSRRDQISKLLGAPQ